MPLELRQFETEQAGAPLSSPYGWALTVAVISDVWRLAGRAPPDPKLLGGKKPAAALVDKLGVLAHLLASTSLREASVEGVKRAAIAPEKALPEFLEAVAPLTAEMIRANIFRREELVRRWLECVGGTVASETPEQSAARLQQLDYRQTLSEYRAAEKARKAESERRAKLLAEAAEKEAAARGWRE